MSNAHHSSLITSLQFIRTVSSALGPYMPGTGTSNKRRYTDNWPRWWTRWLSANVRMADILGKLKMIRSPALKVHFSIRNSLLAADKLSTALSKLSWKICINSPCSFASPCCSVSFAKSNSAPERIILIHFGICAMWLARCTRFIDLLWGFHVGWLNGTFSSILFVCEASCVNSAMVALLIFIIKNIASGWSFILNQGKTKRYSRGNLLPGMA